MTGTALPPRVVIDTNLVLSALVFAKGRLASLRQAWQERHIQPLISRETAADLIRALAYPKFKLSGDEREDFLADTLPCCITVNIPNPPNATLSTPDCRDRFDLPFLHLAVAGQAGVLVTGDEDLLVLAERFVCPILTAEQFMKRLNIR